MLSRVCHHYCLWLLRFSIWYLLVWFLCYHSLVYKTEEHMLISLVHTQWFAIDFHVIMIGLYIIISMEAKEESVLIFPFRENSFSFTVWPCSTRYWINFSLNFFFYNIEGILVSVSLGFMEGWEWYKLRLFLLLIWLWYVLKIVIPIQSWIPV